MTELDKVLDRMIEEAKQRTFDQVQHELEQWLLYGIVPPLLRDNKEFTGE